MRLFPLFRAILRDALDADGKKIVNLATPTQDADAANKKYVDEHGGGSDVLGKLPLRALPKYLHALSFDDTYPADAEEFYDSIGSNRVMGGCSIVRKGGLVGGNFDYPYDDACTFAIKVSAAKGANADGSNRHASVGAAYLGTRLTENIVSSGVSTPLYRVLPGMTESGINDAGVYAKINVIPRDESKDPVQSTTRNLHALAVVRYVLDHFDNAADAAMYVAAHYYIPEGSADSYHWMIADKIGTYIIEDGFRAEIGGVQVMTNFRSESESGDTYGTGYSRYEILRDGTGTIYDLLSDVRFTNAYATGWPWPDEFAGQEDADGKIPHDADNRLKAWAEAHVAPLLDANRKPAARGNGCWQTVHSCIYDFEKKTMAICVQEDFSKRYVFAVDQANVDLSPIEAQLAALQDGKRDLIDEDAYKLGVSPDGPWTATCENKEILRLVVENGCKPDWAGHHWSIQPKIPGWTWDYGDYDLNAEDVKITVFNDETASDFTDIFFHRPKVIVPDPAHKLAKRAANPTSGALAKFGADGELEEAEKSSTSQDPANADYRDPQDNTCHKTEFSEWTFSGSDYDPSKTYTLEYDGELAFSWTLYDGSSSYRTIGNENETRLSGFEIFGGGTVDIIATRSAVCTNTKRFVTEDVAAKRSDIFGSDGNPSDTFATDLFGKPVAKTALMIPLEEKTGNFTAEDGHAYAVTMTGTVTITMPTTTEGKAAIFQARFSAAAQQSVQFDTDDVVKFDGTDCGIVKAGKDALLSAMWNGEAWDLVWKNEA